MTYVHTNSVRGPSSVPIGCDTRLTARTQDSGALAGLDRPDAGNSVTRAMQRSLIENLQHASGDPKFVRWCSPSRRQAFLHRPEPA